MKILAIFLVFAGVVALLGLALFIAAIHHKMKEDEPFYLKYKLRKKKSKKLNQ